MSRGSGGYGSGGDGGGDYLDGLSSDGDSAGAASERYGEVEAPPGSLEDRRGGSDVGSDVDVDIDAPSGFVGGRFGGGRAERVGGGADAHSDDNVDEAGVSDGGGVDDELDFGDGDDSGDGGGVPSWHSEEGDERGEYGGDGNVDSVSHDDSGNVSRDAVDAAQSPRRGSHRMRHWADDSRASHRADGELGRRGHADGRGRDVADVPVARSIPSGNGWTDGDTIRARHAEPQRQSAAPPVVSGSVEINPRTSRAAGETTSSTRHAHASRPSVVINPEAEPQHNAFESDEEDAVDSLLREASSTPTHHAMLPPRPPQDPVLPPTAPAASVPSAGAAGSGLLVTVQLEGSSRRKRLQVPASWDLLLASIARKLDITDPIVALIGPDGAEIEELGEIEHRDAIEVHVSSVPHEPARESSPVGRPSFVESQASSPRSTGSVEETPEKRRRKKKKHSSKKGKRRHRHRGSDASGDVGSVSSERSSNRKAATPTMSKSHSRRRTHSGDESEPSPGTSRGGSRGVPDLGHDDWDDSPVANNVSSFAQSNVKYARTAAPPPAERGIKWDTLDARTIIAHLRDLLEEEPADQSQVLAGLRMFTHRAHGDDASELQGTVGVMLLAMRTFADVADIVGRAVAVLIGLTNSATRDRAANKELIARAGGISALTEVLRDHSSNRVLLQDVTIALNNLAVKNLFNKSTIAVSGAVRHIVASMYEFSHSTDMLEPACSALGTLAVGNQKNKSLIVEQGGAQALIKAMEAHPHHGRIQYCAAAALNNLALNSQDHKSIIVDEGGIKAIADAMGNHMDSPSILFSCCSALKTLAMKNTSHKGVIVQRGIIGLLIRCRKLHRENSQVQKAAQAAMRSVGWWEYDEDRLQCATCDVEFTIFTRQHHCRACGRIFCASCADFFLPLPEMGLYEPSEEVRTCGECSKQIIAAERTAEE